MRKANQSGRRPTPLPGPACKKPSRKLSGRPFLTRFTRVFAAILVQPRSYTNATSSTGTDAAGGRMGVGRGAPEKRPLPRRLRARRLPELPEEDRFCVACGRDTPGGRLKTTVCVPLRARRPPGVAWRRPFSCCCRRDTPPGTHENGRSRAVVGQTPRQLLRKTPKVCALI